MKRTLLVVLATLLYCARAAYADPIWIDVRSTEEYSSDHIDGDATNNRRENLRLVCPNCDSQLPTYKSRNRGKGRHFRRQRYANGQSY